MRAPVAADVPYLSGRVVDDAEILSPAARERLSAALKAHEDKTTNQIVVLTVPTIGQESIEEYANRVFDEWKLGQKGKDNGVLVVVAPKDRKMRIEVGYGLEGTLTDALASRIIRNEMTPQFKSDDFDGGIESGVEAIVALLDGGRRSRAADAPSRRRLEGELRRHSKVRTCRRGRCASCSARSSSGSSGSSRSSAS